MVKLLLKRNVKVEEILRDFHPSEGFYALPSHAATKLKENAFGMCQLQVQLSEHFEAESINIFNVTSKLHFTLHSVLLAEHVRPFLVWCFTVKIS